MSQVRFEQYKDALRRGHVAALQGRLLQARDAYLEASELAPDRALPFVSLGVVWQRLGRPRDAEAAFGMALQRAPADEGALRGRADLRERLGRRREAADDWGRLADALQAAGRTTDALDAARRALELAESRARRTAVERLVAAVRANAADAAAGEALERAMQLLDPVVVGPTGSMSAAAAALPAADGGSHEDGADRGSAESEVPAEPAADPAARTAALVDRFAAADAALRAGTTAEAREALLALAADARAAGLHDVALDACLQLLVMDPSDAAVQIEIAQNQFERGWDELARTKARLLSRLAQLEDDPAAAAAVAAFAADRNLKLETPGPPASG